MRRVRILDAAAREAVEAAAWYDAERPGLGAEFDRAIEAALDFLEDEILPLSTMPGEAGTKSVKRLVLRRFPFDVVVTDRGSEIVVIAFAHHSRRPGYWRGRLRT